MTNTLNKDIRAILPIEDQMGLIGVGACLASQFGPEARGKRKVR